jgi:hypothetical protein
MFGNINSFLNSITSLDFESYSNKTDWFSKLSTGRRQSLIKHISTKIQNQYRDNTIVQKEITSYFLTIYILNKKKFENSVRLTNELNTFIYLQIFMKIINF